MAAISAGSESTGERYLRFSGGVFVNKIIIWTFRGGSVLKKKNKSKITHAAIKSWVKLLKKTKNSQLCSGSLTAHFSTFGVTWPGSVQAGWVCCSPSKLGSSPAAVALTCALTLMGP